MDLIGLRSGPLDDEASFFVRKNSRRHENKPRINW